MPRQPRPFVPGYPAHLRLRGVDRQDIFLTDGDRLFFIDALRSACIKFGVEVHAYVLMTNHVHLVASQTSPGGFANAMQSVGRRYVAYFNRRRARTGTLWEGRYRAVLVDTDFYLSACYRYVEQNPVRAGLVTAARDYLWSSNRANASGREDSLVTPHSWYLDLAGCPQSRAEAYRTIFIPLDKETLERIRYATCYEYALGDAAFLTEVAAKLGRSTERKPRGWPAGKKREPRQSADNDQ
jgi:putative transposase